MVLDFTDLSAKNTKKLNQIADTMKDSYTLFVDKYCKKYGADYLFWATPFASRNTFHDDTFLRLCRVRLALELIKEGGITEVVTETKGEYLAIKAAVGSDIKVVSPGPVTLSVRLSLWINRLRQYFAFFIKIVMYIKCSDKTKPDYPEHFSVVIGFVTSADFDGYVFQDNYMPGIENCNDDVFFLPFIVNNGHLSNRVLFEKIRNCTSHRFIYDGRLVRIRDLCEILKYWKMIHTVKKGTFFFEDLDVSGLIRESMESGKNNSSAFEGLIMRKMIQRLKRAGAEVNNCVIWYEGQPKDLMVSSAIREEFPDSYFVGYQGRPLVETLLSDYISQYQYHSGYSPLIMAVPSRKYEYEARRFCREIPLIYIPILRNDYKIDNSPKPVKKHSSILVLLSIVEEIAREELVLIDEYVKDNPNYHVIIKNHPTKRNNKVQDYGLESVCFEPEYAFGKLDDVLKNVDVVVASATTSGLEVLCAGVPLIVICPKGQLGFAALPREIKENMCHMVYGKDDMALALNRCLSSTVVDNNALRDLLVEKSDNAFDALFR